MTYTMKALGCDLPQRLRDLLKTIHEMNAARYVADAKMHEMGAVAMDENWDVCRSHIDCITGEIAKVISDGNGGVSGLRCRPCRREGDGS
ncbi:MAG: hypothetical protein ABWY82_00020 [Tardiphaga sp.]|jgi:hypothetical protein